MNFFVQRRGDRSWWYRLPLVDSSIRSRDICAQSPHTHGRMHEQSENITFLATTL